MIIQISEPQFLKMPDTGRKRLSQKIIQSSMDGNHYFVINTNILKWVEDNWKLNTFQEEQVKFLKELNNSSSCILEVAKIKLDVKANGGLERTDEKNWSIGYNKLIESEYLDKPAMLVENIKSDGGLYKLIFELLEKTLRNNYGDMIRLSYGLVHGGGGTTNDVFEHLVNENKLVVCVCDSDLLVPGGNQSNTTFKKVWDNSKIFKEKGAFFGDVIGTPCREVENFLSLDLIENLRDEKVSKLEVNQDAIKEVRKQMNNQNNKDKNNCLYLYFDIKYGIDIRKIIYNCRIEKNIIVKKTKKYHVKIYKILLDDRYDYMTYDVTDEDENRAYQIFVDGENYSVKEFIETFNNNQSDGENLVKSKIDEFEIDRIKFEWFLEKYDKTLDSVNGYEIAGISRRVINEFLGLPYSKQQKLLLSDMEAPYWNTHFKEWFEILQWYFFSTDRLREIDNRVSNIETGSNHKW